MAILKLFALEHCDHSLLLNIQLSLFLTQMPPVRQF